jgi:hypothetical protein
LHFIFNDDRSIIRRSRQAGDITEETSPELGDFILGDYNGIKGTVELSQRKTVLVEPVDIVPKESLRAEIRESVLQEMVTL